MFDLDFWNEIWEVITRNRTRSILTALGVFWGIFMLVVMSGFGSGVERGIQRQVSDFAVNSVFCISNTTSEAYGGFKSGRQWQFSNSDIEAVKTRCDGVKYVSGIYFGQMSNVSRADRKGNFQLFGHMPQYRLIEPQAMLYGRYINEEDMRERRKVCSIGQQVYSTLFDYGVDPVGQVIQVNSSYYTVIGVHVPLSNIQIGGDTEKALIMPFTTLQQAYNGGDKFWVMAVAGEDDVDAATLEKDVKAVIRERHSISPDDKKAIIGFNLGEEFQTFGNMLLGITILVWVVGAGTLMAGIVGISNIMLVVTRERTHEIGVRRALGATPKVIRRQIIVESFTLTLMAGIAGISFSVGVLALIDMSLAANAEVDSFFTSAQVPFGTVFVTMLILIGGGVAAGLLPANKALEIKAVDAIREE